MIQRKSIRLAKKLLAQQAIPRRVFFQVEIGALKMPDLIFFNRLEGCSSVKHSMVIEDEQITWFRSVFKSWRVFDLLGEVDVGVEKARNEVGRDAEWTFELWREMDACGMTEFVGVDDRSAEVVLASWVDLVKRGLDRGEEPIVRLVRLLEGCEDVEAVDESTESATNTRIKADAVEEL